MLVSWDLHYFIQRGDKAGVHVYFTILEQSKFKKAANGKCYT